MTLNDTGWWVGQCVVLDKSKYGAINLAVCEYVISGPCLYLIIPPFQEFYRSI